MLAVLHLKNSYVILCGFYPIILEKLIEPLIEHPVSQVITSTSMVTS